MKSDPEYAAKKRRSARRTARKRRTDPETYERMKAGNRQWAQEKRQNDPEWEAERREREHAATRERRRTDPDWKARNNAYQRERYHRLGGHGYRRHLPTLLMRQLWLCALCGGEIDEASTDVHVDHIVPVSKGGGNEIDNLQATHATCNIRKGARA